MAINKVVYGNETILDISSDDITANDVLLGKKFHSSDGVQREGNINLISKEYTPQHTEVKDFFNPSTGFPEYITINAVDYANLTVTPTKEPQEFNRDPDNLDKFYLDVYVNGVPTETEDIIAITQDRTVYPSEGKFYENVTVKAVTPTFPSADKILKDEVVKVVSGGYTLASRTGSMPNNGSVSATLDTSTTSYTIPKGYHSGSGTVKVTTQSKTATPKTTDQTISSDSGKVISSVLVKGVTCNFPDADKILKDEVVSVMSNGTTLASILGSFEPEEGTPTATGTFTTSSTYTTPTPIELGFRPKYVFVWHSEANTGYPNFATHTSYGVYYKDDNEERVLCAKNTSTQPSYGIFKETSNYITFTDKGFTHKPYNSNHINKKAIYLAIGDSSQIPQRSLSGSFNTDTTEVTIECGFKPTFIFITNDNNWECQYNADGVYRQQRTSGTSWTGVSYPVPNTQNCCVHEITDTGFVFGGYKTAFNFRWFAIG